MKNKTYFTFKKHQKKNAEKKKEKKEGMWLLPLSFGDTLPINIELHLEIQRDERR